jgi:hypothetical protein
LPGIDLAAKLARALGGPVADLLPKEPDPDDLAVTRRQARKLFDELVGSKDRAMLVSLTQLLGTDEHRDGPRQVPRHSRPALRGWAARVRMGVGCGSSMPCGAAAAPVADSQAGSPHRRLRRRRHPGAEANQSLTVPGKEKYRLLTQRALCGFTDYPAACRSLCAFHTYR